MKATVVSPTPRRETKLLGSVLTQSILATPVPPVCFVVAAYDTDGVRQGWLTSRETLSYQSNKAVRLGRAHADNAVRDMQARWSWYSWLVQRPPVEDFDCRTRKTLPRLSPVDSVAAAAVESPTGRIAKPASEPATLRATSRATGRKQTEETDMSVTKTKRVVKRPGAAKAKSAAKTKGPKGAAKVVRRVGIPKKTVTTAARKPSKSARPGAPFARPAKNTCLCGGCDGKSTNYFVRGHIRRFTSNLAAVRRGDKSPKAAFGAAQAKAMGPWRETKTGFIPATINYEKIRTALGD